MSIDPIGNIVLQFLELYGMIDYRARQEESDYYRALAEKFRSYSRTIAEAVGESPHDALLFMLSKASLSCLSSITERLGSLEGALRDPEWFLGELEHSGGCSSDKLAYTVLFLAGLILYSKVEGVEVEASNLLSSVKALLARAADIRSPYQELLEILYSQIKRAAEAAFSEAYT